MVGEVRDTYLTGFYDAASVPLRLVASGQADGVFELALPFTVESPVDPQAAVGEERFGGKLLIVTSAAEDSGNLTIAGGPPGVPPQRPRSRSSRCPHDARRTNRAGKPLANGGQPFSGRRQTGCWTRPELLVCCGAPRRNRTGDPILTMDRRLSAVLTGVLAGRIAP